MLIPSLAVADRLLTTSLSNANSQHEHASCRQQLKLIKKGEC
ncbi:hypothetical protein BLOI2_1896 [Bifidobacterium longum subsp. longum]|nr:hypothetical protein BLOI2_1896 [Bifidobacterium longum subsp. longum]